jgi:hypothetical protein
MEINFQTENLILIHYNPGAGGKFLSMCLSINESVLQLQPKYAENKVLNCWSEEKSFRANFAILKLSKKYQKHLEFSHGKDLYGFSYLDNHDSILKKSNRFFKELTWQKKYFFFLTFHFSYSPNFFHFKRSKNIIIINDEKLLKIRKYKNKNTNYKNLLQKFEHCFLFDISTIRNPSLFQNEIKNLCNWLKLEIKNHNLLQSFHQNIQSIIFYYYKI